MFSKNNIQVVTPGQFSCLNQDMYALGNVELLNSKCIAVAGSRKIDSASSEWLKKSISKLHSDYTVVSGLALGTDAIAHKSAINNNLPTIAVLPSGIGNITPKSNIKIAKQIIQENGLLLSEYPFRTGIKSNKQYIDRNKIIIDISNSLLVPQFDIKSGTRHTVDFAQKAQKTIYIQDANYTGNQYIINNDSYKTFILKW